MPMPKNKLMILIIIILNIQYKVYEASLPSKCPTPDQLQSEYVKNHFETNKMQGFWYEIAMKDATQPRFCKCQTSNKTFHEVANTIQDDFRIECEGRVYLNKLSFNLTSLYIYNTNRFLSNFLF